MTLAAYRYLLAIDSGQVESKALQPLSSFSDVPDVMHLYVLAATTDCTVIEEPGLGLSWPPNGE